MPFYSLTPYEFSIAVKGFNLNRGELWRMTRRVAIFIANAAGAKIADEQSLFHTFGEQEKANTGAWTEARISKAIEKLKLYGGSQLGNKGNG